MSEQALVGTCHCRRVRITLPRAPEEITQCNCSLCSKTGFQGIYYSSNELVIEGETDPYVREDLKQTYLATRRCRRCGVVTHWTPLTDPPHERMGVNVRLFDESLRQGVPVKQVDGRSWDE